MERKMSAETWNQINRRVARIAMRAAQKGDNETYADADMVNALLRNLANEIKMEDDRAACR